MKRPRPTTIATVLIYAIAIAALVFLFVVQQQRIDSSQAQYDHLFAQYTKSVDDCARSTNCTSTVPAPSVIKGAAGTNGLNGTNGQNATDAQVESAVAMYCQLRLDCQGPTGLPGMNGPSGVAGTNGTNGADGEPGAAGPAGSPGADGEPPESWTYTDAIGLQHTCSRTDPFDASAPTYQCT